MAGADVAEDAASKISTGAAASTASTTGATGAGRGRT